MYNFIYEWFIDNFFLKIIVEEEVWEIWKEYDSLRPGLFCGSGFHCWMYFLCPNSVWLATQDQRYTNNEVKIWYIWKLKQFDIRLGGKKNYPIKNRFKCQVLSMIFLDLYYLKIRKIFQVLVLKFNSLLNIFLYFYTGLFFFGRFEYAENDHDNQTL